MFGHGFLLEEAKSMETAFYEIVRASPVAGALIVLVIIFLKALDKRDARFDEITRDIINRNTTALEENTKVISTCRFVQAVRDGEHV